jgi:HD superfamily phosphodiesterase
MSKINYKQQLEKVKDFVLAYFHTHQDGRLVYHNLDHTKAVVEATMQIANHYQLNDKDFFIVTAGAWFHDTGYFEDIQNHEEKSADNATAFLKEQEVPADDAGDFSNENATATNKLVGKYCV